MLTLRDNGPRKRDKCVRRHLPASYICIVLPKGVKKGNIGPLSYHIFSSPDTLEHGLEQMDRLVGMVTDLDLVQFIAAHSGRSKSGSGQSSAGASSSSSRSFPQSGNSSLASDSPENPGSDCSEELSSDGSASH